MLGLIQRYQQYPEYALKLSRELESGYGLIIMGGLSLVSGCLISLQPQIEDLVGKGQKGSNGSLINAENEIIDSELAVGEEGVEGSLNSVDDIIKGVENGELKLSNNIQKGNYGEMKMDAYFESQGYERITLDRVTDLNAPTHHGIDGVYYNPDGHPPYIIGEAKYGSSKLSTLADGTRQMSTEWIEGGKGASRLDISVGKNVADDILLEGYDSVLVNVDKNGNITTHMLDGSGQIIK